MRLLFFLLPIVLFSKSIDLKPENDFSSIIASKIKENLPKYKSRKLTSYYKINEYKTFWLNEYEIKELSYDLLNRIKNDPVLKPKIATLFDFREINKLINDEFLFNDLNKISKLDFELTKVYDKYMNFLSNGLINWKEFSKKLEDIKEKKEIELLWEKYSIRKNRKKLLTKAIKHSDLDIAFSSVDITFPKGYELYSFIKFYEELEKDGGFIKLKKFSSYPKLGSFSENIFLLRQRLMQEPLSLDLSCTNNVENCKYIFDENIKNAVKSFQKNNGKFIDGKVGLKTVKSLNIPVQNRIKQLRLNYERMRWLPRTLGKKHLIVNIPDYKLKLYDENTIKLEVDVIVGKTKFPTPIFSNKISSVVLNPYWRIPQKIVKNEIIPKLVEDPFYLEPLGIRVHENWDNSSDIYDTSEIEWSDYLDNDLIGNSVSAPMRFIQIPSKHNPLGRMKFMFPNKYSIYLHDTPSKYLFRYKRRAFSHGCVRLKKPKKLLEVLSQIDKNIDYKSSSEILKDIEKTKIRLNKSIPVHLVYLTSWVGKNGDIQFRDDIYNYDRIQGKILYK